MAIDRAEAARIAELARLELAPEELEHVAAQLSVVLAFAATLDELDLSDLEPTAFAPVGEPLRRDEPDGRTFAPGIATAGAPAAEAGYFLVPPIVENLEP